LPKSPQPQMVSVIIPTYNRQAMLKEAVESVLAQDYQNFELIVVDDGSTDLTPETLKSYGEAVTVIRQHNQGVSSARNAGIKAASADLVAFLDSDDLWLPQKLSSQTDFFKANPEALICQTQEIWIRNGVRANPKKQHQKVAGMIFEPSLKLCLVSPSAVMMRTSLFETVGLFDQDLPACEDYDLWLRISCRYPIYLIDKPLVIKRGGHADQLSRASGLDKFRIQAIIKIIQSGRLSPAQYHAAVETLHEKCKIYACGCRKRKRIEEAAYYETLAQKYRIAELGTFINI